MWLELRNYKQPGMLTINTDHIAFFEPDPVVAYVSVVYITVPTPNQQEGNVSLTYVKVSMSYDDLKTELARSSVHCVSS